MSNFLVGPFCRKGFRGLPRQLCATGVITSTSTCRTARHTLPLFSRWRLHGSPNGETPARQAGPTVESLQFLGGTVFISVPECGIDGHAQVLAIEPCPEILPGDGRVITGTFRHQVSASISLSIAGQQEPILCTGNHPFWSEDRQDFVRADSLKPNETLRTTSGSTTVTSLTHVPGSTAVYNLEIHGTHVYHVGSSGVLVHNGDGFCPPIIGLGLSRGVDDLHRRFGALDWLKWQGRVTNWDPTDRLAFSTAFREATENAKTIIFHVGGDFDIARAIAEGATLNVNKTTTSWEFLQIISNPKLLEKTKFWDGKKYIDIFKQLDDLGLSVP